MGPNPRRVVIFLVVSIRFHIDLSPSSSGRLRRKSVRSGGQILTEVLLDTTYRRLVHTSSRRIRSR